MSCHFYFIFILLFWLCSLVSVLIQCNLKPHRQLNIEWNLEKRKCFFSIHFKYDLNQHEYNRTTGETTNSTVSLLVWIFFFLIWDTSAKCPFRRVGPCVLHSGKVETIRYSTFGGETLCHSTKLEVFITSFAVLTPGGRDGLFKMDPAGSVPSISRYVSASAPYYIGNLQ